jgi:hypothetical protein
MVGQPPLEGGGSGATSVILERGWGRGSIGKKGSCQDWRDKTRMVQHILSKDGIDEETGEREQEFSGWANNR